MLTMKRGLLAGTFLLLGILAGRFLLDLTPLLQGQAPPQAAVIPRELTSYRDIVKKVLPAVVSIEGKSKPAAKPRPAPQRRCGPVEEGIPEEFRRFFEDFQRQQFDLPDE